MASHITRPKRHREPYMQTRYYLPESLVDRVRSAAAVRERPPSWLVEQGIRAVLNTVTEEA